MGKLVYTGSLSVAAAAQFGYADINPPEREGYANEIVRIMWHLAEVAVTEASQFVFGCSAKVPKRTTFTGAEFFDLDMIVTGIGAYRPHAYDSLSSPHVISQEDAYFLDELRLVVATEDGANHANGITAYYRLEVEEKKLTDKVRDLIHIRSYS